MITATISIERAASADNRFHVRVRNVSVFDGGAPSVACVNMSEAEATAQVVALLEEMFAVARIGTGGDKTIQTGGR